jgi:6-phosphogluconolactonase
MKVPGDDAFAAEAAVAEKLSDFSDAIDVAVLGMGEDGHTASFFPGAETLDAALDRDSDALCLALRPPAAPHDRMTLSLAALLKARQLYLHITGEKKWEVLQQALESGDERSLPISSVCHREDSPLEVFYSP